MKKRSNITLLIIGILLLSIPVVGYWSFKHPQKNYPSMWEYFNSIRHHPDHSSLKYNIKITYDSDTGSSSQIIQDSISHE
ncbi:hypothetical protein [Microbacter margulisiae]|uniref:Uncharacterized protein n=1 Tax=Microbacter margulisiae TaxID=1350067 RepID=A0A7W5H1B0_9PORP|nr:hypothetical protein [Microbacter margulisiae]MBB3186167.1 hypothetical protein [Microbacter margulisiae]